MAITNTIGKISNYTDLLDEVYQAAALTAVLDSDASMARAGNGAHEICLPKMSLHGLGDYDRQNGYPMGAETLEYETKQFNYERGRMFQIDAMDNEETAGVAYGRLAGEFIRTKVAPEMDAVRLAAYCAATAEANRAYGSLSAADGVFAAVLAGMTAMDENEVPEEGRYLFITPTLENMLANMDTYKSKEILNRFAKVVRTPAARMYSAVTLLTGADSDAQRAGGYAKATGATNINFLIAHKGAVLQIVKHQQPKVITPEQNQTADAWKFGYRVYGINEALDNKVNGLYVHTVAELEDDET